MSCRYCNIVTIYKKKYENLIKNVIFLYTQIFLDLAVLNFAYKLIK